MNGDFSALMLNRVELIFESNAISFKKSKGIFQNYGGPLELSLDFIRYQLIFAYVLHDFLEEAIIYFWAVGFY